MIFKKLPYILVTLLVALLIGCGSSNPFVSEAESSIQAQDYKAALESAEKSIEQHPGDPLGYYYKAVALGEIAGELPNPGERTDYYKRMNETFETAQTVADTAESVPSELGRVSSVKNVLWQTEHNKAIEYVRSDSLKQTVENPMQYAMDHLRNATIIQPDSSLSWNVLAQVAGMNKKFDIAVDAKNKYMSMVADTSVNPDDYMQLASYHFNQDNQQAVLEVFERAQKQYPENEDIVSNLADAYNRVGMPEKAIATVEKLVEQNPENPQYHLVLGTQIYQQALKVGDTLATNSEKIIKMRDKMQQASPSEKETMKQQIDKLIQENQRLQNKIDNLTARAEDELKTTIEYRPKDDKAYNTLGIIYQNKAKAIFDQRNRTTDNEKAAELDKQGRELLRESMKYYEKAAEIKPDNQEYWRSLFQIYTTLGMDKKAKEAMQKAGMSGN